MISEDSFRGNCKNCKYFDKTYKKKYGKDGCLFLGKTFGGSWDHRKIVETDWCSSFAPKGKKGRIQYEESILKLRQRDLNQNLDDLKHLQNIIEEQRKGIKDKISELSDLGRFIDLT